MPSGGWNRGRGGGLVAAAENTADWLERLQALYHALTHPGPKPGEAYLTRDACDAGMCGDYREHRDALRWAVASQRAGVQARVAKSRGRT